MEGVWCKSWPLFWEVDIGETTSMFFQEFVKSLMHMIIGRDMSCLKPGFTLFIHFLLCLGEKTARRLDLGIICRLSTNTQKFQLKRMHSAICTN